MEQHLRQLTDSMKLGKRMQKHSEPREQSDFVRNRIWASASADAHSTASMLQRTEVLMRSV